MGSNKNSTNTFPEIADKNEKLILNKNINIIHTNEYCITHQIRWFKGSRDRGLRTEIAL